MDTVCRDKKCKKHDLERGEGDVGCEEEGGCWAGCEDGVEEVDHEGRHGGGCGCFDIWQSMKGSVCRREALAIYALVIVRRC